MSILKYYLFIFRRPSDVNDRVNGIASASNGFFSTTDMYVFQYLH